MNILVLSDVETFGGAAVAATRLVDGLIGAGCQITRVVGQSDGQNHSWRTLVLRDQRNTISRVVGRLRQPVAFRRGHAALARSLTDIIRQVRPDVINMHNIHSSYWGPEVVDACQCSAPLVWTLHDMWSFTGRCVYNYECRKFESGCDASCPTWTEYPSVSPERILSEWKWRQRLLDLSKGPIAVCPSTWLAGEAKRGLWARRQVAVIPYGLPLEVYRPVDRNLARAALDLPVDGSLLVTAAVDIAERRKGGALLSEALRLVKTRPLTLAVMGRGRIESELPGIRVVSLGYIEHERTKVLAYSAADAFVHPAPVDNLPNVVLEAIACGTPVIGFPVGGVPEMVRSETTGWLALSVSGSGLAAAIDMAIIDIKNGLDLRSKCRHVAEAEYGTNLQARRYIDLFNKAQGTPSVP